MTRQSRTELGKGKRRRENASLRLDMLRSLDRPVWINAKGT